MDSVYAEAINSFSFDLDHLWKDKNKFRSENKFLKNNENCSLNRFLLSINSSSKDSTKELYKPSKASNVLCNVERLAKTASIWTHPELQRIECDKILQDFEKGVFIVRMTSDKRTMVLSYRADDKVQHVMIKVNVQKGFYMDGSTNIFKNVNAMIAHYMTHSVQTPDVVLKLPKALREAHEPMHFNFFKNLKLDFWKTSLANKSIDEIWPPAIKAPELKEPDDYFYYSENTNNPPLPPRGYDIDDVNIIQGMAEDTNENQNIYTEIKKAVSNIDISSKSSKKYDIQTKSENTSSRIYSGIWNWSSEQNLDELTRSEKCKSEDSKIISDSESVTDLIVKDCNEIFTNQKPKKKNHKPNGPCIQIKDIIKKYYPQILDSSMDYPEKGFVGPSLTDDIMESKGNPPSVNKAQEEAINEDSYDIYEGLYAVPWDIQTPWITKLMDIGQNETEKQSEFIKHMISINQNSLNSNSIVEQTTKSSSLSRSKKTNNEKTSMSRQMSINSNSEDDDLYNNFDDEKLTQQLLIEIQPVLFSPSTNDCIYNQNKSQYGQSIRKYLRELCSPKGTSEISKSIAIFIQCTIDHKDLSPYTTMRLIRQYMSGLKNFIKQQKSEISFVSVIEEERKRTPKNVFINLDSIMESVLTKTVLKPLASCVNKLLVLEHYKNHNLNLISEGIEIAKHSRPERLGLQPSAVEIINSKIEIIKGKFSLMRKTFSPEIKIGHLISIIEIIFKMVNLIYPKEKADFMSDVKTDHLLPILVYIFSQCKKDAIAAQCEVEYIEGLIWSTSLVNGEPGFYLMNIMSSLEAVKVLSRPSLTVNDLIDLKETGIIKIDNSTFITKTIPYVPPASSIGSVNVIILDEKVNRLVTKTFPIKSTINARNLCNSIAHRLGIFNPLDYSLYKLTGTEDILLDNNEFPLQIKQAHQQKTNETLNFIFKRKNASFILPSLISAQ